MNKLLVAGSLTLAVILGAAFVIPHFVDWNRFKPELTGAARDRFGLAIQIDGNVDIDLLPRPRITMNRATVLSNEGGNDSPPVATMRWARVELDMHGFLTGNPRLVRLDVVEPIVTDPLFIAARVAQGSEADRAEAAATMDSAELVVPMQLRQFLGERIGVRSLSVQFDPNADAWRFDGFIKTQWGPETTVTGKARPRTAGGARVELSIGQPDSGRLDIAGAITPADDTSNDGAQSSYRFHGRIDATIPASGSITGATAIGGAVKIASDGVIELDPLTIEIPAGHAEGTATIQLTEHPSLSVVLSTSLADFDDTSEVANGTWAPLMLAQSILDASSNLDMDLNLSVDRARWRNGLLGGLELRLSSSNGETRLDTLEARLPGDLRVSMNGTLESSAHGPRLIGGVTVTGNSFREGVGWIVPALMRPLSNIPRDRFRQFAATAAVDLSPGSLFAGNLAGEIDGEPVHGQLGFSRAANGVLGSISVKLDLASLHLAPLAADSSEHSGAMTPEQPDLATLLARYRTDIGLSIESVTLSGARIGGGRFSLSADPSTGAGTLSASVQGPGEFEATAEGAIEIETGGARWTANTTIQAPKPTRTLIELGMYGLGEQIAREVGPFSASLAIDGWADGAATRLNIDGKHADLTLAGSLALIEEDGEPALQLQVEEGGSRYRGVVLNDIAGQLSITQTRQLRVDHLIAILGRDIADLSLTGTLGPENDSYRLDADLVLENIDLRKTIGRLGDLVVVSGRGWFGGRVTATAPTPADLLDDLNGSGKLDGRAILRGTKASGGTLKLGQFQRLRDWLDRHFGGNGAKLGGTVTLASGDLAIRDLTLSAKGAAAFGRATLDLNEDTIVGRFEADDRKGSKPYFILDFSNRLSNPDVRASGEWVSGR